MSFQLLKKTPSISIRGLQSRLSKEIALLDAWTPSKYRAGHTPRTISAPLNKIPVYNKSANEACATYQSGTCNKNAARILARENYHVINVRGGMSQWSGQIEGGKQMKIVIIGDVVGGMSAAIRLRRLMKNAEIVAMEKGPFVSFTNCGLPYYVFGEIVGREQLLIRTPGALKARFNLDARPHHEVVAIDPIERVITMKHETEILTEHCDKLVLSPRAKPLVPPTTELAEAKNVFPLRNAPDLDRIMTTLTSETKRTAVINAGLIGLKMVENLQRRRLEITLMGKASRVLPSLDEETAAFVETELSRNNVQIITG